MLLRTPRRRAAAISPGRPRITYAGSPFSWAFEVAAGNNDPTATGGTAVSYAIVGGALPPGVTLNPATGRISGTPSSDEVADQTGSALVRCYGPGGSSSTQAAWEVVVDVPVIEYEDAPFTWPADDPVSGVVPTNGGAPAAWTIEAGALPEGLTLDPDTGEITGTPTTPDEGSVTIRATNTGGQDEVTIDWEVT